MTLPLSPSLANQAVVWGGLLIGLGLGAVAQSTRFCTMGALADWFSYGGSGRLMMWLLAVLVAACGTQLLLEFSWLDESQTNAWSVRLLWPSNLVGGLVFGFGMVLASGCPQRNLVRLGAGSLKALCTLLVTAIAAQMTLRGLLSGVRVGALDAFGLVLPYSQDLGSLLGHWAGWSVDWTRRAVLLFAVALACRVLYRQRQQMQGAHWLGGALIGLLLLAAWMLTGHIGYLPEHPDTLEPAWMGTYSHRPEGLTFAAPLAHGLDLLTLWSDRNTVASYGLMVCVGTLLGSAASALTRKQFRLETFGDAGDTLSHLTGAVLMGFGGVTAMGCSIGQGVTGMAQMSAGACLALAGMVSGSWLALRFQSWRLG